MLPPTLPSTPIRYGFTNITKGYGKEVAPKIKEWMEAVLRPQADSDRAPRKFYEELLQKYPDTEDGRAALDADVAELDVMANDDVMPLHSAEGQAALTKKQNTIMCGGAPPGLVEAHAQINIRSATHYAILWAKLEDIAAQEAFSEVFQAKDFPKRGPAPNYDTNAPHDKNCFVCNLNFSSDSLGFSDQLVCCEGLSCTAVVHAKTCGKLLWMPQGKYVCFADHHAAEGGGTATQQCQEVDAIQAALAARDKDMEFAWHKEANAVDAEGELAEEEAAMKQNLHLEKVIHQCCTLNWSVHHHDGIVTPHSHATMVQEILLNCAPSLMDSDGVALVIQHLHKHVGLLVHLSPIVETCIGHGVAAAPVAALMQVSMQHGPTSDGTSPTQHVAISMPEPNEQAVDLNTKRKGKPEVSQLVLTRAMAHDEEYTQAVVQKAPPYWSVPSNLTNAITTVFLKSSATKTNGPRLSLGNISSVLQHQIHDEHGNQPDSKQRTKFALQFVLWLQSLGLVTVSDMEPIGGKAKFSTSHILEDGGQPKMCSSSHVTQQPFSWNVDMVTQCQKKAAQPTFKPKRRATKQSKTSDDV